MAEALDTLQIADDLESSGLDREQAKAIAHAVRQGRGDLVTKSDLEAGLAALKSDIKSGISDAKADVLKWMFGAVFALGAWVFAIIRMMPPTGS